MFALQQQTNLFEAECYFPWHIQAALALLLTAFAVPVTLASTPNADVIGDAYSLDENILLYREYHYRQSATQYQVIYKDLNDITFSQKQLDYTDSPVAPSFQQHNDWSHEKISVQNQQQYVRLSYKNLDKERVKTLAPPDGTTLVIDAGFHSYIQQHWQALLSGQTMTFIYAVASRQELLTFIAKARPCSFREASLNTATACFVIKAKNPIIHWLVDELQLVYHSDTRQLLQFSGLTNINDHKGKGVRATIRYHYP